MTATPDQSARTDAGAAAPPAAEHHDLALEPAQAWILKGITGESDEIIIPGLLLDDLGGCTDVEAALELTVFHQMLAMASLQEARMLAARAAAEPKRIQPEANVWHVEGPRTRGRVEIQAIRALDRVVVDSYGTRCIDSMRPSELIPGPRAWR